MIDGDAAVAVMVGAYVHAVCCAAAVRPHSVARNRVVVTTNNKEGKAQEK